MGRVASMLGDIFWSAIGVGALLIVFVLLLRLLGKVAPNVSSKIGSLADPANA